MGVLPGPCAVPLRPLRRGGATDQQGELRVLRLEGLVGPNGAAKPTTIVVGCH